jgi:hypothetical protein
VIKGWDQGEVVIGKDRSCDVFSSFRVAVIQHDGRTVTFRGLPFRRWSIIRHHHSCWDLEYLGSSGNCLSMVTGGIRNNPTASNVRFHSRYSVKRSSELERPRPLQMLSLEVNFGTKSIVQQT